MPGRTDTTIQKVALAGKGYVGGKIYNELVNAGFDITILSRSNEDNAPNVKVVDYESIPSLTQALEGQDAVVSALAVPAWPHQKNLIDAAVEAGVKHFIPSDYTALSTYPEVAHLPWYREAVDIQNHLKRKCAESAHGMKWTVVATGPMLGCVLGGSYMLNFQEKTALITSDPEHPVSMTLGPTLGKAVASIFKKSGELESGPIFIHSVSTTQKDMLELAEKFTGTKWPVQTADGNAKLPEGVAMYEAATAKGEAPPIFATFLIIHGSIFGGSHKTAWDGKGNELLGVPTLTKEEFAGLIETRCKGEQIDGGLPWNSAPKPRK